VAVEREIPLLGTKDSFFYQLGADLKMRCDILAKSVEKAGFIVIKPEAGAFLCANWKPLGKACMQKQSTVLDAKKKFHL